MFDEIDSLMELLAIYLFPSRLLTLSECLINLLVVRPQPSMHPLISIRQSSFRVYSRQSSNHIQPKYGNSCLVFWEADGMKIANHVSKGE